VAEIRNELSEGRKRVNPRPEEGDNPHREELYESSLFHPKKGPGITATDCDEKTTREMVLHPTTTTRADPQLSGSMRLVLKVHGGFNVDTC
jgi:hypothetical protein